MVVGIELEVWKEADLDTSTATTTTAHTDHARRATMHMEGGRGMKCCDLAQGIFGDRFVVAEAATIWRWKQHITSAPDQINLIVILGAHSNSVGCGRDVRAQHSMFRVLW